MSAGEPPKFVAAVREMDRTDGRPAAAGEVLTMPLTHRGHEMLERLPQASFAGGSALGCEIVRHDELCVGCGKCAAACPTTATRRGESFDVSQLLDAPPDSRRGALGAALRACSATRPTGPSRYRPG